MMMMDDQADDVTPPRIVPARVPEDGETIAVTIEDEADDAPEPPPRALDLDARHSLRSIAAFLRSLELVESATPRVQFAIERASIAACERAARIFAADLPEPDPDERRPT